MSKSNFRIGQIVPSSNTTMETEIPKIFGRRETGWPERFTFHSSRMRMKQVTKEELQKMDIDSDRCALELSDAQVDVLGYACLVAIMSMGHGYHCVSQNRLHQRTVENGFPTPVVTSAGALVEGLRILKAKKIAVVTPYMKPLTQLVVEYIGHQGFEVTDSLSLEIPDNLKVGAQDPVNLVSLYKRLNLTGVDTLVLSACVQMPSLPVVQQVQEECGLPVITASISTAYCMMKALGLKAQAPGCGELLSGKY